MFANIGGNCKIKEKWRCKMKTESLNKLFVELDIMFNTANSMDAFYHHFANAKMIFNHEFGDEEKL